MLHTVNAKKLREWGCYCNFHSFITITTYYFSLVFKLLKYSQQFYAFWMANEELYHEKHNYNWQYKLKMQSLLNNPRWEAMPSNHK